MPRAFKTYLCLATVRTDYAGRGFPIDMLRRDHCYPSSEEHAATISRLCAVGGWVGAPVEVEVAQLSFSQSGNWTTERWQSFGWHITPRKGVPV